MRLLAILLAFSVMTGGCATYMDETQSGALAGSALGAGLGAIIGNQTGHAGAGTAIGAGAGALFGGLAGEGIKRSKQQPATLNQYPPQTAPQPPQQIQESHSKYNPITGQTFPERFRFDPADGTELKRLQ